MNRILIALALVLSAAVAVPAVAQQGKSKGKRPEVIQLPTGFGPEGITTSKRHTFFVGGRDTGEIYKGSLRTGEGATLVEGVPQVGEDPDDRAATGLKVDKRNRLFVSGADSGFIRVYDANTGEELRSYEVDGAGFINDVVITRRGAYFTDSLVQKLYFVPIGKQGALGELKPIPITGDFVYGPGFNANGIEAARGGKTLISVRSSTGELYAIDALTGESKEIEVTGTGPDTELANGDGLLLKGRKLYVVENRDTNAGTTGVGEVTVVRLGRNLSSGRIVREIVSDRFAVPTTIARSGGRNYVVNAKFGSNTPDQTYEVVMVPRR